MKPADPSVLIVDDDAQLGRLVAIVAERCGFKARVALSAREAWLALDPEPALVLLDLNMPDADGLEVLRELASRRCSAQIRVFSGTDPRILRSAASSDATSACAWANRCPSRFPWRSCGASSASSRKSSRSVRRRRRRGSAGAPVPPMVTVDELRHGIRTGEIFVVFESIVDLETLSPLGAEALVRWRHPVYGVVPPVHFVALAESSGLAVELTERIFALALEFAGRPDYVWAGRPLSISINVAAAALIERRSWWRCLPRCCRAYNVAPGCLVVEVTETVMSADRTRVLEVLSRLRLRGVELSIDDFGTGTSSLERLDQFPFTELKIERAFIADLLRRPDAEAIVRSTIELARRLDLRVVGEGIEDVRTLQWLRGSGCATGQGFLFARGLEEHDFLRWLDGWSERRTVLLDGFVALTPELADGCAAAWPAASSARPRGRSRSGPPPRWMKRSTTRKTSWRNTGSSLTNFTPKPPVRRGGASGGQLQATSAFAVTTCGFLGRQVEVETDLGADGGAAPRLRRACPADRNVAADLTAARGGAGPDSRSGSPSGSAPVGASRRSLFALSSASAGHARPPTRRPESRKRTASAIEDRASRDVRRPSARRLPVFRGPPRVGFPPRPRWARARGLLLADRRWRRAPRSRSGREGRSRLPRRCAVSIVVLEEGDGERVSGSREPAEAGGLFG